jgi:hypothetical protein
VSTHFLAAASAVVAIPLTWRRNSQTAAGFDLTPSMHESALVTSQTISCDQGPMLVTVEYRIHPQDREAFLDAVAKLRQARGSERRPEQDRGPIR